MGNKTISNTDTLQTIQELITEDSVNYVLLQAYANTISAIPNIDLSYITFPNDDQHVVADIKTDQTNIQKAVEQISVPLTQWQSGISDVIGFVNLWESRYNTLITLLNDIDTEYNKPIFINGIQGLINNCNLIGKRSALLTVAVNDYITGLTNPVSLLNRDKVIVDKYFSGDGGAIKLLESQINTLNDTMKNDNETISRGALKQGLGVLIITIVVVAKIFEKSGEGEGGEGGGGEEPDDDSSNKIIEASIDMIKDDIKQQSDASEEWSKSFVQYQNLVVSLSTDQQLYSAVVQISNTLASLLQTANNITASETELQNAWNELDQYLESIITEVFNDAFDADAIKTELSSMNDQLTVLKTNAVNLQSNGIIQVMTATQPDLVSAQYV
jgi:hypothetical protein